MRRVTVTAASALLLLATSFGAIAAGNEPFSQPELEHLLVGKTYPLGHNGEGAFYFYKDGRLSAIWKGKKEDSRWTISSGNKLCYSLKLFGGHECLSFLKKDSKSFIQVYYGKKRTVKNSDLKNGKTF